MNNRSISDNLAKVSVYIQNNKKDGRGSGFILKSSDEHDFAYLLTAKHVILGEKYQENPDYLMQDEWTFDNDDFDFYLNGKIISLYKNQIFFLLDVDIAFGLVSLSDNSLGDIKKIRLSDNDFSSNYKVNFYTFGYPVIASKEYGHGIELDFIREVTNLEQKESVFSSKRNLGNPMGSQSISSNISKALGGLSGSGIFLNKESDCLHVNSLIIKADGFSNIIALNLLEKIEKINELISKYSSEEIPRLEVNQNFEFDDESIKLESIDYEKFIEKIGELDENELSRYGRSSSEIINEKRCLEKNRKKLAQYCIKLALSHNEKKQYHLSTRYFNHAIDLDSSYKPLFLISKNNRSKYNKAVVKIANETLMTHDLSYEDQYELIKQKIVALESDENEQYKAIIEFFNINQNIKKTESIKLDIENYLLSAKNIINKNICDLLKSNGEISIEDYLYMAEKSELNESFYYSVYFLYAARDLAKLIYDKNKIPEIIAEINKKLSNVLNNKSFDHSMRSFDAQREAEEQIRSFEKIKEESEAILFNDVKDILQKLNDIYDKTNDSGILQEISKTIDSISKKINPDTHNQDVSPSDIQDEEKPNKKTGFGLRSVGLGLFIDVFLFIGMVGFLTGSAVNTVIG